MKELQVINSSSFLDKLLNISQYSTSSLPELSLDYPSTASPNIIVQIFNEEIQKRLIPIYENQKFFLNKSTELILSIESMREELNSFSKTYIENTHLKKKIKNINSFLSFKKFDANWNDNNAEPFHESVLQRALDIINSPSLKYQPNVFPTGRQSVQFEYEKLNGDYLEIEIFDDHYSAYREIKNQETEFNTISLDQVFRLIDDFHSRF